MKLLELLTQTNGVSGNEEAVCEIIKTEIKDYVDEIFATYILEIDYDRTLGFDVTENPFVSTLSDGLLGTIILGM